MLEGIARLFPFHVTFLGRPLIEKRGDPSELG